MLSIGKTARHFCADVHRLWIWIADILPATVYCFAVISFSVSHFTSIATRISYTAIMEQQLDLTKLSDSDKKELNQVLTNEAQKSNIQQSECSIFLSGYIRVLYFMIYKV